MSRQANQHRYRVFGSGPAAGRMDVILLFGRTSGESALKQKSAKDLLEGKEILLKSIPGKEDKPSYDIYVKLIDGKLDTRKPTAEDNSLGACPTYGKLIIEGTKGFGCSVWREGCKFRLSKELMGQTISVIQMKKLLKTGKTDKISGFTGAVFKKEVILVKVFV